MDNICFVIHAIINSKNRSGDYIITLNNIKNKKFGGELDTMTVKGVNYELVDRTCRNKLDTLNNELNGHKNSILELAKNITTLKQYETVRRVCLTVDDVISFPILKMDNGDFSMMLDCNIICNDILYSAQHILKYIQGHIYHGIIDNNISMDFYFQVMNGYAYIFIDPNNINDKYNLNLNIIMHYGDVPKMAFDDNKFSINNYPNATLV